MQPQDTWSLIGTRNSTFDWWSLIHLGFYAFLASSLEALARWFPERWYFHLCWFLPLTIGWEVIEHFAERRWPEKWGGKIEHWSNRWIGDQISNSIGLIFGVWVVWQ